MGHYPFAGLKLALVKYLLRQRVADHGLGSVCVCVDCYLLDAARVDILLELGEADILGQRIVVDIEHPEQKDNDDGIGPVHAEPDAAFPGAGSVWFGSTHRLQGG